MNITNDYFELMRYIEKCNKQQELIDDNPSVRKIFCHANHDLIFPSQTIQSIAQDELGNSHIYINYLGLYGVDSPLPHHWLSITSSDSDPAKKVRAFLDIFQQRIYDLLYQAWKKYQVIMQLEPSYVRYLNYLQALSGGVISNDNYQEFVYVSLFGHRVHNALSLTSILNFFCKDMPVTIKQFVSQWDNIEQNNCISHEQEKGLILNNNAMLGNQIINITQRILIELGPISFNKALLLLRDKHTLSILIKLIKKYINVINQFALVLLARIEKCHIFILGKSQLHLGWGSFIGNHNNLFCKIRLM